MGHSRTDHMLYHKVNLGKFKKTEIISNIFSHHKALRLEINYKEKNHKNCQQHKHMEARQYAIKQLMDHQRNQRGNKKIWETNDNVSVRIRNPCVLSSFNCVWIFATLWTPLSLWFSRQEYWSGLPFPSPGDLPDPGIKSSTPVPPALAGRFFTDWAVREALLINVWRPKYSLDLTRKA